MRWRPSVTALFVIAAIYDGAVGLMFLFAPAWAFERFGVTPPNHFGYVQFPAALLLVFAWMFIQVALRPIENRLLIPYAVMLKAAYCGVVFYYWVTTDLPAMWKPFAVADLLFAALFVAAYRVVGGRRRTG